MSSDNIDLEAGQVSQEEQPELESTTPPHTSSSLDSLWDTLLDIGIVIILFPPAILVLALGVALVVLAVAIGLAGIALAVPFGLIIVVVYVIVEAVSEPPQKLLDRLPIVLYIPAPDPTNPSLAELPSPSSAARWEDNWVESDLPYVVLEQNNAGCLICMMDFDEPRRRNVTEELGDDGDSILQQLEKAQVSQEVPEPLRQLPCNHVFHKECVDPWILNESTKCPYCRRKIQA